MFSLTYKNVNLLTVKEIIFNRVQLLKRYWHMMKTNFFFFIYIYGAIKGFNVAGQFSWDVQSKYQFQWIVEWQYRANFLKLPAQKGAWNPVWKFWDVCWCECVSWLAFVCPFLLHQLVLCQSINLQSVNKTLTNTQAKWTAHWPFTTEQNLNHHLSAVLFLILQWMTLLQVFFRMNHHECYFP